MAIKPGAILTFVSYTVLPVTDTEPDIRAEMTFSCADPGPGQPGVYVIDLTDAQMTGLTTPQLQQLVIDTINAKYRPQLSAANATRLNGLIGQQLTLPLI